MGKTVVPDLVGVESTGLVLPYGWVPFAFSEGLSCVYPLSSGYRGFGYIDLTGQWVIQPQFQTAECFRNGLAAIQQDFNSKWGYIDKEGEMVIPPRFDNTIAFSEGLAVVCIDGYCGFINRKGRIVIPCQYRSMSGFFGGLANVEYVPDKWGYINKQGQLVIVMPSSCRWAQSFSPDGLALTHDGYINTQGKVVINRVTLHRLGYNFQPFFEGLACFKDDSEWGFINKKGEMVIEPQFQELTTFKEGLAPVKRGWWGYINQSGETVVPVQFKTAGVFSEGVAWVSKDGLHSFLIKHP